MYSQSTRRDPARRSYVAHVLAFVCGASSGALQTLRAQRYRYRDRVYAVRYVDLGRIHSSDPIGMGKERCKLSYADGLACPYSQGEAEG